MTAYKDAKERAMNVARALSSPAKPSNAASNDFKLLTNRQAQASSSIRTPGPHNRHLQQTMMKPTNDSHFNAQQSGVLLNPQTVIRADGPNIKNGMNVKCFYGLDNQVFCPNPYSSQSVDMAAQCRNQQWCVPIQHTIPLTTFNNPNAWVHVQPPTTPLPTTDHPSALFTVTNPWH